MKASSFFESSLALQRELNQNPALHLNNLGMVTCYQGDPLKAMSYLEESLRFARESQNRGLIALSLCSLGEMELYLGNHQQARAHYLESLRLRQELGDREGIAYSLEGLAGCCLGGKPEECDHDLAARLLGAADAIRKAMAMPLSPLEVTINQRSIDIARATLGEAAFQTAWQAGASKPVDELVQEMLQRA
jgi:tetratricopeptide (TPR) repeat protein